MERALIGVTASTMLNKPYTMGKTPVSRIGRQWENTSERLMLRECSPGVRGSGD